MQIIDVIHGYQPYSKTDTPPWVLRNLKKVFLPTSQAMKEGLIKRSVQLQGWTIDNWLSSHKSISEEASRTLQNLREAKDNGFIDVGFSAYSHAILPFLSDSLVYAQLKLDYLIVFSHLGRPNFLFYPEGAADSRIVKLSCYFFPEINILLPNKCVPNLQSGVYKISALGKKADLIVYNVFVKDILMGAAYFDKKHDYAPQNLIWEKARKAMQDSGSLIHTLKSIEGEKESHFIVRDWENAQSKEALTREENKKEIKAFIQGKEEGKLKFKRISELDLSPLEKIDLSTIKPGSWEPLATDMLPYPYWKIDYHKNPEVVKALNEWHEMIKYFDVVFQEILANFYGDQAISSLVNIKKCVDSLLKEEKYFSLLKKSFPALISCVPWHLTSREEWDNSPELPIYFAKKVLLPSCDAICELYNLSGGKNTKDVWEKFKEKMDNFISLIEGLKKD